MGLASCRYGLMAVVVRGHCLWLVAASDGFGWAVVAERGVGGVLSWRNRRSWLLFWGY